MSPSTKNPLSGAVSQARLTAYYSWQSAFRFPFSVAQVGQTQIPFSNVQSVMKKARPLRRRAGQRVSLHAAGWGLSIRQEPRLRHRFPRGAGTWTRRSDLVTDQRRELV